MDQGSTYSIQRHADSCMIADGGQANVTYKQKSASRKLASDSHITTCMPATKCKSAGLKISEERMGPYKAGIFHRRRAIWTISRHWLSTTITSTYGKYMIPDIP
eukprot:scaffold66746_cov18-Tisochrysis_lutea.AAC.2